MSILKVARMGHPVLRQVAENIPVEEITKPAFQTLIDDMIETMGEYDGIGLAAPQVHQSIKLALLKIEDDNPRYKNKAQSDLFVFINPKITPLTEAEQSYWEGCLSLPGLRGLVPRPKKIKVEYLDRQGKAQEVKVDGFLATVFQHEFDHLEGKLYIDRIRDTKDIVFEREFEKYILPNADQVLD